LRLAEFVSKYILRVVLGNEKFSAKIYIIPAERVSERKETAEYSKLISHYMYI